MASLGAMFFLSLIKEAAPCSRGLQSGTIRLMQTDTASSESASDEETSLEPTLKNPPPNTGLTPSAVATLKHSDASDVLTGTIHSLSGLSTVYLLFLLSHGPTRFFAGGSLLRSLPVFGPLFISALALLMLVRRNPIGALQDPKAAGRRALVLGAIELGLLVLAGTMGKALEGSLLALVVGIGLFILGPAHLGYAGLAFAADHNQDESKTAVPTVRGLSKKAALVSFGLVLAAHLVLRFFSPGLSLWVAFGFAAATAGAAFLPECRPVYLPKELTD